jgi:hypothetical protein
VHDTTKIWRIWDFKSGRSGRAVECSSLIFQEEENAHGRSVEEKNMHERSAEEEKRYSVS